MTAGTTNEKALRDLAAQFKIDMTLQRQRRPRGVVRAARRAAQADAFATDDVLLYGLLAQNRRQARVRRRPATSSPTTRTASCTARATRSSPSWSTTPSTALAEDREIERRYTRWFLRKLPSRA